MIKTLISISSLLISYAFLFSGNALLTTLISLRAQLEDFPTLFIGIINAGYFLGLYLGAKYSDRLVTRVGHGRAYAVFASYGAICALLHAIVVDPYIWTAVRIITGFCLAGLMMITESWLNSRATNTTRGQIFSMLMITHYLSSGFGQLYIPLADPNQFTLFSIAAIGYCLSLGPVLITRLIAPEVKARQKIRFRDIYNFSPVGFTGAVCCGLITAALLGLAPVYTQGIGMSVSTTANFMALLILSGVFLQWPVGRLSDRMDRRKLLVAICLISALSSIFVLLSAGIGHRLFLFAAALFGAFAFTMYPITAAHMHDATPEGQLLYASAGLLTAFSIGAIIGPILAATVMQAIGYNGLFVYLAFVFVVYSLLVIWRMSVKPAPERKKFRRFFRIPKNIRAHEVSHKKMRDQMDRDIARLSGGGQRNK